MKKSVLSAFAAAFLVFGASVAHADNGGLAVNATVGGLCYFNELQPINFGSLMPGDTANASSVIMFTCTNGIAYTIDDELNGAGVYSGDMDDGTGVLLPFSLTYGPTAGTGNGGVQTVIVNGSLTVPIAQATGSYYKLVVFSITP